MPGRRQKVTRTGSKPRKSTSNPTAKSEPKLLSGGNPQIPKGDGDEPVERYIAAMPGWQHTVGRKLDDLITRSLPDPPGVRKAVKWNTPFYGVAGHEDDGWFLSFHCFTIHQDHLLRRRLPQSPAAGNFNENE